MNGNLHSPEIIKNKLYKSSDTSKIHHGQNFDKIKIADRPGGFSVNWKINDMLGHIVDNKKIFGFGSKPIHSNKQKLISKMNDNIEKKVLSQRMAHFNPLNP